MKQMNREITDIETIEDIIKESSICRIGFNDYGNVSIVPFNFGYLKNEDQFTFYFHCANDGNKVDLIKQDPYVGFEMDNDTVVYSLEDEEESTFSQVPSVVGNGIVRIVEENDEKQLGLNLLLSQYLDQKEWQFKETMLKGVTVFKLEVDHLSCKVHS